jgi:hypothetical protein
MAQKRKLKRATALSLAFCGLALFAAQAGVVPGIHLGADRESQTLGIDTANLPPTGGTPAALAAFAAQDMGSESRGSDPAITGFVADPFARLQTIHLPPRSGFSEMPAVAASSRVAPISASERAMVRPAAFEPARTLTRPTAPVVVPVTGEDQALSPLGLPCGLDLTADAVEPAMLALGIAAPCHPGARVTVSHANLTVALHTDAVGLVTLDLPALESPARVTVRLPDGTEDSLLVPVPDLDQFRRVALTWRGDIGMELHAIEAGGEWMSDRHIRPDVPRSAEAVASGDGFLTLLGDGEAEDPMMAQVLTLPRRNGPGATMSVDAPINERNCGRAAEATMLQSEPGGGRVRVVPLGFTYPGCEAVGDTLLLQNLEQDQRFAAN